MDSPTSRLATWSTPTPAPLSRTPARRPTSTAHAAPPSKRPSRRRLGDRLPAPPS